MAIHSKVVFVFSFFVVCSFANAQDGTWQIILSTKDTLHDCTLLDIADSMLVVSRDAVESVPIGSIDAVFRHHKKGEFWTGAETGAIAGSAVGAFVGVLVGAANYSEPKSEPGSYLDWSESRQTVSQVGSIFLGVAIGVVGGAVGGGVIGGVVTGSAGGDEVYDFSTRSQSARIMILRTLLNPQ